MDSLWQEFNPSNSNYWKELIEKDLKGQPYEKLIFKTEDGIEIQPFYTNYLGDRAKPIARKERNWLILEKIPSNLTLDESVKQTKEALEAGADGFSLVSWRESDRWMGPILQTKSEWDTWLDETKKAKIRILSLGTRTVECSDVLQNVPNILTDFDPIGTALLCGRYGSENWKKELASLTRRNAIAVHTQALRESGATIVQELAYGLAWLVDYWQILLEHGIPFSQAANSVWLWTSVGVDYFGEIAKYRALRLLVDSAKESYSSNHDSSVFIHSESLAWAYTTYDPYVNLLRGTTSSMAAILGGVDSLSTLPYDTNQGKNTQDGLRWARNTQLLFKYESYLDKVEDPSLGSFYIESLTDSFVEEAWKLFLDIESKGGFLKEVESGSVQKSIHATANSKRERVRSKKLILLGTNQYPNREESYPDLELEIERRRSIYGFAGSTPIERLVPHYSSDSIDFERYRTDVTKRKKGKIPRVALFPIGDFTMRKARAGFALNFIGTLGYDVVDHNGFANLGEGFQWLSTNGPWDCIVLCSSDEEYPEFVPPFCKQIGETWKNAYLLLAGFPKEHIDIFKKAGIQDFIHLKRDLADFMKQTQDRLLERIQ